jgi:hypothetical protein
VVRTRVIIFVETKREKDCQKRKVNHKQVFVFVAFPTPPWRGLGGAVRRSLINRSDIDTIKKRNMVFSQRTNVVVLKTDLTIMQQFGV